MNFDLATFVADCASASRQPDAQHRIAGLLREAVQRPTDLAEALSGYTNPTTLEDLAFYRSEHLTLLHGLLPPGFQAAPHNHNLWSVVGVYEGQEDNVFYVRNGDRLLETRRASVVAPGVLENDADAIHSIENPRSTGLRAVHAYGGDLFATPRSNWDAETHEEQAFDWRKVANR